MKKEQKQEWDTNTLCIPYISLYPYKTTKIIQKFLQSDARLQPVFTSIPLASVTICSSNKNFILKYFRCRDGKRTETRIGMEGICITHSFIPLYTVYMQHIMAHSGGMQEWVIQIPSIPILVSVLFHPYI